MAKLSFFSVLKSNLGCAFCKEENCPVRYFPERKKIQYSDGHRFVTRCKKDWRAEYEQNISRNHIP